MVMTYRDLIRYHLKKINRKLDKILAHIKSIEITGEDMSLELDTLAAQVKANTDAEQSAVLLIKQIADMLVAAKTDPAKVQALSDQLKASAEALSAAVVANTPVVPPAPVVP